LRRKKKRKTKNLTFKKYEKFIEKEEDGKKAISAITIQSATDEKPNGGKMKEN